MAKTKEITVTYGGKVTVNYQSRELTVSKTVMLDAKDKENEVRDDIYVSITAFVEGVLAKTDAKSKNNPDDVLDDYYDN